MPGEMQLFLRFLGYLLFKILEVEETEGGDPGFELSGTSELIQS